MEMEGRCMRGKIRRRKKKLSEKNSLDLSRISFFSLSNNKAVQHAPIIIHCSLLGHGFKVEVWSYWVWYAVSFDQATDNVKAGCGRPTIDALTISKSSQGHKNTWKNKWPISFYHIPNMWRYCWMGRELWCGAARMAQGLASPVMAYLSLSLSISSAPEHSSGLRAVDC